MEFKLSEVIIGFLDGDIGFGQIKMLTTFQSTS